MQVVLSDIWGWWLGAAKVALGQTALVRFLKPTVPVALRLGKDGIIHFANAAGEKKGEELSFLTSELSANIQTIGLNPEIKSSGLVVRLDSKHFIVRNLSSLNLPASQIARTALLDLRANTPFKESDVHVLGLEHGIFGARYAVVKRATFDPVLSALAGAKIPFRGILLESDTGPVSVSSASFSTLNTSRKPLFRRMLVPALGVLAVAIVATGIHAWNRNQAALSRLQVKVDQLTAEAKATRTALDRRSAALAELSDLRKTFEDAWPVSGLWEELTRVLPDSAYLTDLEIKDGRAIISGYAKEAAALIVALEQSPVFQQASFNSPVIRAFDQDAERFQISLSVEGKP